VPLDRDYSKEDLDALEEAKDLLALRILRDSYPEGSEPDADARPSERQRQLLTAYRRVLGDRVARVIAFVNAGMWESKDCQALRRALAEAEEGFREYDEDKYRALDEGGKNPEKVDDYDLPEEMDGYGSDDSDDEAEPLPPPPKADSVALREHRKKVKRQKRKHKERVEKGTGSSGKAPITWRTYGLLEPNPNDVIQHVLALRRKMEKAKDDLAPDVDKAWKELAKVQRWHDKAASKLEAMKEDDPKRKKQAAHLDKLLAQIEEARKPLGDLTAKSKALEEDIQRANPAIRHPLSDWTAQVERDFQAAKVAFAKGDVDALKALKTRFCIAQYRGITYNHKIFSEAQRRLSRNRREVGEPVFCMSVLYAAGVRPDDYFEGRCTDEEMKILLETAQRLKKVLVDKRAPHEVTVNGYKYASFADAIQDIYTNKYDYIHATIQAYLDNRDVWLEKGEDVHEEGTAEYPPMDFWKGYDESRDGPAKEFIDRKVDAYDKRCRDVDAKQKKEALLKQYKVIPPSDWALFDGLLNGKNPFVSTGDTPRHALKYAYGMKFYKGHEHERLAPRWAEDGKALHPYSGKVFVSVHPLDEYMDDAPNHVPSMNMAGRIVVGDAIADERETTFPAYIPGERVVFEHVCKFPSFHRPWRTLFLRKYGLDKEMYDQIANVVKGPEVQQAGEYRNLESWLVNFHESRLVELVRQYALGRGMMLIYRNSNGELSRGLTSTKVHKGSRFIDPKTRKWTSALDRRAELRIEGGIKDDRSQLEKRKPGGVGAPKKQTFRQRIQAGGYAVHGVPGDGNCFFHALLAAANHANYVPVATMTHAGFRTWLVGQYANYADIRAQQNATPAYITEMSQAAVRLGQVRRWGSDAEVILFCRASSSRVIVHAPRYPNDETEFAPFGVAVQRTLHLVNSAGDHWEWATAP
jgi:hypothetical protein